MIKKQFYCLLLLIAAFLSVSCAREQPILNLQNQPTSPQLTSTQVKKCIELAGINRGWKMQETKPGLISGSISRNDHYAQISIPYSNSSYSINYQSSQNLLAEGNTIHRNYNKWIKLLNQDIQSCLVTHSPT